MPRNLDLTALRSFVTVVDSGGVTRAAGLLHLTQSAVSMQLKRLEEGLGLRLLDRSARQIGLTGEGEQLLSYARRMLALNDEAVGRLTASDYEGEITLGVPHDIVPGYIPQVLKRFAADFPRMRVNFLSSNTRALLQKFDRGEVDMIVTTEEGCGAGGETLAEVPLVWVGAPGGRVWKERPLPIALETQCIFRPSVQRRLDAAGIAWLMRVETGSTRTVEATVSADLAVHAMLSGFWVQGTEPVDHGGALPDLKAYSINLYRGPGGLGEVEQALAGYLRDTYGALMQTAAQPRPSRSIAAIG
jgi:DNA-binding transcriptional LysR family regulator